ncbi:unnamed protein product, partial [Staurois parvus]
WGPRAIGDHGAPVSLPKLKKAYEKGTRGISWGPLLTPGPQAILRTSLLCPLWVGMTLDLNLAQGRTDNSWGPRATGDHGAPVLTHTQTTPKKAHERY